MREPPSTFFHTGDLGDIIACLPIIRVMDGGKIVIGFREGPGFCRESMKGARFESIRPLLEAQEYIQGVSWGKYEEGMVDFSTFRKTPSNGQSLVLRQARHLGILVSLEPWLHVQANPATAGRVICARSKRYRNPQFLWRGLLDQHGDSVLFVGSPDEHEQFQIDHDRVVTYFPTDNLLSLAEAIAGARLFIGNQSCPFWIAAAMGAPLIQETSDKVQDSIIERENASYPLVCQYELAGRSA